MTEPKAIRDEALAALPLFPLPQVVLFPDGALPLHVFEPRYRTMLADCLRGDRTLAIPQLLPGADERGRPRIATVAGVGVVVEHQALPDGRANIVVLGRARVRLEEIDAGDRPYRVARGVVLDDDESGVLEADRSALVAAATMFAGAVEKHDPKFHFRLPDTRRTGAVADACAFQLVVDADARQAILETTDVGARVRRVLRELALQHGAMLRDARGAVLN